MLYVSDRKRHCTATKKNNNVYFLMSANLFGLIGLIGLI